MTILPKCPSCGLESAEIRCPRCNTLKLLGCSGGCATCGSTCSVVRVESPAAKRAGGDADEACDEAGTPLAG